MARNGSTAALCTAVSKANLLVVVQLSRNAPSAFPRARISPTQRSPPIPPVLCHRPTLSPAATPVPTVDLHHPNVVNVEVVGVLGHHVNARLCGRPGCGSRQGAGQSAGVKQAGQRSSQQQRSTALCVTANAAAAATAQGTGTPTPTPLEADSSSSGGQPRPSPRPLHGPPAPALPAMSGASRSSYPYCLLLMLPLMRCATAALSRTSSVSGEQRGRSRR